MAEPTPKNMGEYYANWYLQTHAQRFQMAQQMALQEQMTAAQMAQMYQDYLRSLNAASQKLATAQSNRAFDDYMKILQLEESTRAKAYSRTVQAEREFNARFDTTPYEAGAMQAADSYATNMSGGAGYDAATRRALRQINPQGKGSDTARALAVFTLDQFQTETARKGGAASSKFNANRKAIERLVADHFGIKEDDLTSLSLYKESERRKAMARAGSGDTLSNAQIKAAADLAGIPLDAVVIRGGKRIQVPIAEVKKGDSLSMYLPSSPEDDAKLELQAKQSTAAGDLSKQMADARKALKQQTAVASRSPEETMIRARQIYSSQFSPRTVGQMRQSQNTEMFMNMPEPMQIITQGYYEVAPGQADYIKNPRNSIPGAPGSVEREINEAAYDLFYKGMEDRKGGGNISYVLHKKAEELFPVQRFIDAGMTPDAAEEEAFRVQKQVIGIVLRAEDANRGGGKRRRLLRQRQKQMDDAARAARQNEVSNKRIDEEMQRNPDKTIGDIIFDESGGTINPPTIEDLGGKPDDEVSPVKIESKPKDTTSDIEIPGPGQPVMLPPAGTVYRFDYVDKGVDKEYGYEITGYDAAGNPILVFRGLNKKKGDPLGAASKNPLSERQKAEAMERYNEDAKKRRGE